MGEPVAPNKAMLLMAMFSCHDKALEWARQETDLRWGPIALQSRFFPFEHTSYYEKEMGQALKLQILVFDQLIDPLSIREIKLETNRLEETCARDGSFPESRPINLDPGYLTRSKFVLATTKDASHRLYLGKGIFAEVTLHYARGAWQHRDWTYPNYRDPASKEFFQESRDYFLQLKKSR